MPEPSNLGERLRRYRVAAGLTQEELAERAGISARAVSDVERGVIQMPREDTIHLLAEALTLAAVDRAALIGLRRLGGAGDVAAAPAVPALLPPPLASSPAAGCTTLPTGMLTFLIADVRGYTAYTHQHGDEAGARLAIRFAALAGEVAAGEGGQVVEVRGDEVLVVFTSARKALRAAVDLVARCAAETTPEVPLRVGVGLDVGEPVAVAGGYRGEVLNVAARLCAQAGPGEVLASDGVVHLARRVQGLGYQDRGELTLKGITRPVRAWLVRAGTTGLAPAPAASGAPAGLAASDVPAGKVITQVTSPPHNLPTTQSSFVGREQARDRVRTLLEAHRMVTLVGAGGVGKTRLALAVGERLLEAYPDGVWLVELAPLADPGLVPGAAAAALGLREEPARPVLDTLCDHCKGKHLLLVLDNCEHLVAASAALAAALLRVPGPRILVTSREALGVTGERHYRVPSLSVPDRKHLPSPELVGSYEAVRLFVARAQERRDEFALTPANARAVADICARLDGVPLAIELAAARVAGMSVEAIATHLDDRFRLLTGGARDLPSRQRTLRAALDWSWDLLGEEEQTLLARLAVFAGGWALEAAEAVCAGEGLESWVVLDALPGLVSKSLVQMDESGGGVGRYRLLETVRQYAAERLAAGGETEALARQHAAYYLALAELAEPELQGPQQGAWLARLAEEHDNLRAALGWARETGEGERGLRLAGALWRFWFVRGHLSEGRHGLEQSLVAGAGVAAALRARALNGAGVLASNQGDPIEARARYQESLALYRELGDKQGMGVALNNLGNMAEQQGNYPEAQARYQESLALSRELGDKRGMGNALSNLGNVASDQGDYPEARARFEQSLVLYRELGDKRAMGVALNNLGSVASDQGNYPEARARLEESLALCRELGDKQGTGYALGNLGNVALALDDFLEAQARFEESLALCRELGDKEGIGYALGNLGDVAWAQGAYSVAQAWYKESLAQRRELGDQRGMAECLERLAGVIGAQGQAGRAAMLCGAAEALREAIGAPLPPNERERHARSSDSTRTALGEQAFATAWGQGRAMPLEEAIALALRGHAEVSLGL